MTPTTTNTNITTNTNNPGSAASAVTKTILIVSIIGALNWGLIGFFRFNLVHAIFGGTTPEQPSVASRIVYMIVGLAGLVSALLLPKLRFEARHTSDYASGTR